MYTIKQNELQAILDYLVTKPYQEVFQLVSLLLQLKPCVDEEKEND